MSVLIILLVVTAVICGASLRAAHRDGRGPQRPPRSHFDDPQFRAPSD